MPSITAGLPAVAPHKKAQAQVQNQTETEEAAAVMTAVAVRHDEIPSPCGTPLTVPRTSNASHTVIARMRWVHCIGSLCHPPTGWPLNVRRAEPLIAVMRDWFILRLRGSRVDQTCQRPKS